MKPTLRQMEYLIAVADTGTFGEAAKRTFVSQPSLSSQIKNMEEQIGVPLVERGRHGTILTPVGQEMVTRARIVLSQVEEMKVLGRESEGNLAGRVKLGVLPTVGPYLLPRATHRLHQAYPDLRLSVREESTLDLQKHLSDGQFDIIISTPEDHPETRSLPIVKENIYICIAPDDPLANTREAIDLHDLKNREFLTLGHRHKFTMVVKNLADKAGAVTSGEYEGTSLDAIRQMASMGGAVAVLPSLYAISEAKRDPNLVVRKINHTSATRQISLIWRHSSPLAEKFTLIGNVFEEVTKIIME